ncbi:unnamed protein product [Rotaria socialis]|uniref:Uncharacterized protein n=1 Tax=Rotaria socialis TaxID=392032 RepID=A0A818HCB1_9BILA|nr:unnamed protein product [Rotaria socialis]CAF3494727.1 unnamed protein product [Rotaria socialis]CAF3505665.1 unnamed protein product [Rotaria socialis]CAF4186051.1 unnamed protein product [Rotaria socialis]CAF4467136.1 unnamed protein product [Rotaria socialis]
MTVSDEELLVSLPPQYQPRKTLLRPAPPRPIHIECHAEERYFVNASPLKINGSVKPIRFTTDNQVKPEQYRSEIVVHSNPDVDLYIKRLRVAFDAHDDSSRCISKNERPSARSQSVNSSSQEKQRQQQGKYRSSSLPPRSDSQTILHQWIDDICSNENLMNDDDICFFLKNGEFLARI